MGYLLIVYLRKRVRGAFVMIYCQHFYTHVNLNRWLRRLLVAFIIQGLHFISVQSLPMLLESAYVA